MAFYNEFNYDYHFIIKDWAEEFKEQFKQWKIQWQRKIYGKLIIKSCQ